MKDTPRPRVLMLLTNAFNPDPRVYQEARALVENGYDVSILCWDRDLVAPDTETVDGIEVERINIPSMHGRGTSQMVFLFLYWLKGFLRYLTKPCQIIHCHDFDTLPLGYLLSRVKRTRLVYDAHESYVDMLENIPPWLRKSITLAENWLIRRTDLLITVGEILRAEFLKRGASNTCIVGNWKNPTDFKFPQEMIEKEKHRLGIGNDQLTVCFIANLGFERQLAPLVEAVRERQDIFLLVGGKGAAQRIVEESSAEYSNIHYLGYVAPRMVPFYTALSDVVFYGFDPANPNSRFSAPNKLFEAIAAGKAILTGDFGEIGKITRELGLGCILQSYTKRNIQEAFDLFLGSNGKSPLRGNQRKAAQFYNWQTARGILLDAYSSVLCSTWKWQELEP